MVNPCRVRYRVAIICAKVNASVVYANVALIQPNVALMPAHCSVHVANLAN